MTNQKIVYSYNPVTFEYVGETIARRDPLEQEEIFLIPAYATDKQPIFEEGKIAKFVNNEWMLEEISSPPEQIQPTPEERKQKLKNDLIVVRKSYLASTDWYAARKIKRGIEIPQSIIDKEILCAQDIDNIEACDTLEELNQFSSTFE